MARVARKLLLLTLVVSEWWRVTGQPGQGRRGGRRVIIVEDEGEYEEGRRGEFAEVSGPTRSVRGGQEEDDREDTARRGLYAAVGLGPPPRDVRREAARVRVAIRREIYERRWADSARTLPGLQDFRFTPGRAPRRGSGEDRINVARCRGGVAVAEAWWGRIGGVGEVVSELEVTDWEEIHGAERVAGIVCALDRRRRWHRRLQQTFNLLLPLMDPRLWLMVRLPHSLVSWALSER